jgi:hypothetical protein
VLGNDILPRHNVDVGPRSRRCDVLAFLI